MYLWQVSELPGNEKLTFASFFSFLFFLVCASGAGNQPRFKKKHDKSCNKRLWYPTLTARTAFFTQTVLISMKLKLIVSAGSCFLGLDQSGILKISGFIWNL